MSQIKTQDPSARAANPGARAETAMRTLTQAGPVLAGLDDAGRAHDGR